MRVVGELCGGAAVVIGAVVIVGWVLGIEALTRLHPEWVTMKFATALGFVIAGGITAIDVPSEGRTPSVGLAVMSSTLLAVLASSLHVDAGILIAFGDDGRRSLRPGLPSYATIGCFALIGLSGFLHGTGLIARRLRACYVAAELVGWAALFGGYVLDVQALRFGAGGTSTEMAAHTAVGFVLLGRARMTHSHASGAPAARGDA